MSRMGAGSKRRREDDLMWGDAHKRRRHGRDDRGWGRDRDRGGRDGRFRGGFRGGRNQWDSWGRSQRHVDRREVDREWERGPPGHREDGRPSPAGGPPGERREEEKEKEINELEQEMINRRERIAAWRAKMNKGGSQGGEGSSSSASDTSASAVAKKANAKGTEKAPAPFSSAPPTVKGRKSPLDGKEEESNDVMDTSDDVDPLEMFMSKLEDEKKALKSVAAPTVTRVKGKRRARDKEEDEEEDDGLIDASMTTSTRGDLYFDDEDDDDLWVEEEEEPLWKTKSRKRDLEIVDHSKMEYIDIRKKFYIEVPEITNMSESEVRTYREELGNIVIHGRKCPRPIKNFHQCGLSQKILSVCQKSGYTKPTPIQAQAIPACMSGRDVIGIAKTGSGKTLAFLLPMLRHMLDQPLPERGEGPIGLIMAPTRELAVQLHLEAQKFCKKLGTRAVCVYGGAGISSQIGDLKRGAAIVVCTPGRMIDILCTNAGRVTNLTRVSFVVLDEADRMFDMGFEPQIMRIIANIRPDKQMVMFSATFPKSVEVAARKILKRPLEIIVGGVSVVCSDVEQIIEVREEESKYSRLLQLLGEWIDKGNVLVFVTQQEECDKLYQRLTKSGYACDSLHGGKDQADRSCTISDFKSGATKVLVATSVAARGLDVPILRLVVNYSPPNHYEDYVHRCGRTGRAGKKGTAVTFITPEEDMYAPDMVKALRNSNAPVPEEVMALASSYLTKLENGTAYMHGSGFGGSGYRFDEKEAAEKKAQDLALRQPYLSDGEDADVPTIDPAEATAAAAATASAVSADSPEATASTDAQSSEDATGGTAPAASGVQAPMLPVDEAPTTLSSIQYSSTTGKFETEIEINDYPQTARWKVTRKDALQSIIEFTGCAITAMGMHVPVGRKAPEGERKLYLLIESEDEFNVRYARKEVLREINEAAAKCAP